MRKSIVLCFLAVLVFSLAPGSVARVHAANLSKMNDLLNKKVAVFRSINKKASRNLVNAAQDKTFVEYFNTKVTAETVKKLGNSSEQIGTIVSVINDIADQTNLLALNAAIEAARAGEQGRGFAVVADEVRKLAERTTSATKEISTMITAIQSETSTAVVAMDDGSVKVENGVRLANEAGDSLKRIVSGVENVTSMIGHIAVSAEEQSSTTEQITRTMDSIADVARTNVNTVGEVANASGEMERLANELKGLVSIFKISSDDDARSGLDLAPGGTQGLDRRLSGGTGMHNAAAGVMPA